MLSDDDKKDFLCMTRRFRDMCFEDVTDNGQEDAWYGTMSGMWYGFGTILCFLEEHPDACASEIKELIEHQPFSSVVLAVLIYG